MHAQGRLLYVHTLEVLGCTPPAITRHSSHRGVYLVMTYGGSPVTYGQSHTMECTHCPFSPCLLPPQLNEVQSASCFTGTVDAKVEPDAPPPRRRPATSTSTTTTTTTTMAMRPATEPMTTTTLHRRNIHHGGCARGPAIATRG